METSFVDVLQSRRNILVLLREQQKADAACARAIKNNILIVKKQLLTILSEWLCSFSPENRKSDSEIRLFDQVCTGCTNLGEWYEIQKTEQQIYSELCEKKENEIQKQAQLDRDFPRTYLLGTKRLPVFGATDTQRNALRILRSARDHSQLLRQDCQTRHEQQLMSVEQKLYEMLLATTREQSLALLCQTHDSKEAISQRLVYLARETLDLYRRHAEAQFPSVIKLTQNVDLIQNFYDTLLSGEKK